MSTFDTSIPQQDASIWPTAIKWGLIAGAATVVLTMLAYNLGGMDPANTAMALIFSISGFLLGLLFVYLGLKNYKEGSNGGQLSLGKGVMWSLGFGLTAGIIGAIFNYVFYTFLAPDLVTGILDMQMAQMEEQGMDDEQMEAAESMMGMFMSPIYFMVSGFLSSVVIAVIEGLIISAIIKTR
jgi:uncharacterized membrane protein